MLNQPSFCFSRQEALSALADRSKPLVPLEKALLMTRAFMFSEAEAEILSNVEVKDRASLLFLLRASQGYISELEALLDTACLADVLPEVLWFIRQKSFFLKGEFNAVIDLGLPKTDDSSYSLWHSLILASSLAWSGHLNEAETLIQNFPSVFSPPERIECEAHMALLRGEFSTVLDKLSPLLEEGNASVQGWEFSIHSLSKLGEDNAANTMLLRASTLFPQSHRLIGRRVLSAVSNRLPTVARRFALQERLCATKGWLEADRQRSQQNLAFAYEHCGRVDLLCNLHPQVRAEKISWQVAGNRALHLASLSSPQTYEALQEAQRLLPKSSTIYKKKTASSEDKSLRVGFVSPDVCYHPVMRFLLMQLHKLTPDQHERILILTGGKNDSCRELAKEMFSQSGRCLDIQEDSPRRQLESVRSLDLDIAIDLSGWTSNSTPYLFDSRIAPVQVNYLGFFASSGISEMDYWLGDESLFPVPMIEKSTEKIWRLSRCFLAWQPFDGLPEGRVSVPDAPAHPNIVFGSFNHARKLSDRTLRLWGKILEAVPGSRLSLKAYTSDDPGTTTLLRRRMLRCGLNPERVVWLPTTPSPEDHLRQYGLVDIALDPFPNGGCTTTCEALWMGVPVITLTGDRYVGRMSTAVLDGAQLNEWIASDEQEYFEIALKAADNCRNLRDSREKLRSHILTSPLCDASELNSSLIHSWRNMLDSSVYSACS